MADRRGWTPTDKSGTKGGRHGASDPMPPREEQAHPSRVEDFKQAIKDLKDVNTRRRETPN